MDIYLVYARKIEHMLKICKRPFHHGLSHKYALKDIGSLVLNTKVSSNTVKTIISKGTKAKVERGNEAERRKVRNPVALQLQKTYNLEYTDPTPTQLTSTNHFFNTAQVKFEWSASNFLNIPGEKLKKELEDKTLEKNEMLQQDEEFSRMVSANNGSSVGVTKSENLKSCTSNKKYPGKTQGIPFELLNGLPEIAFLGRCNAGKSTLLNNLTTRFSHSKLNEYAKSSRKAGFTKTINCYNIANKFRIIDTPGYGVNSTPEQGEVTMQYLRQRRELRRCFVLISAEQGFSQFDSQIIEFLETFGIPFEIVFTKMDKVKSVSFVARTIEESGVQQLSTLPRIIFLNSVTSKNCDKRYGIDQLRFTIIQTCGLELGTKATKAK